MLGSIGPWIVEEIAERLGFSQTATAFVVPLAILLGSFIAGVLAESVLLRALRRAESTSTKLDDVIARALRGPIRVFAILTGLGLALLVTALSDQAHQWTRILLGLLLGVTMIVIASRVAASLIDTYGERARLEGPSRNLVRRVSTLAIWSLGVLLVLQQQGINVTPLLTTLGLAGLAIALALQDTLSNLFAGVYIQSDRPLDVGHYVRLEEHNLEGYVVEVGWRTSKIRTLGNNLIVIPNARLANTIVTDYDLPESRMSLLVNVPVPREVDTARIEMLIVDEAKKAAGKIPGFLATPEPFVRFIPGFTEKGFEFTLVCQVQTFVDQYAVQHELRHRITARLRAEGLVPAVPHREIRLRTDGPATAP